MVGLTMNKRLWILLSWIALMSTASFIALLLQLIITGNI